MVAPRIIWRYILRETSVHALLGLAVITLLLVVANTLRFLEQMVGAGVGLGTMGRLLTVILPTYFSYAIPTALVFGILLTFGRMSLDGEIVALRAGGLSIRRLMPPVLALGVLASGTTAYLLGESEPRSHFAMKSMVRELAKELDLLEPRHFQKMQEAVVYTHGRGGEDCPLRGVLIAEFATPERPYYVTSRCARLDDSAQDGELAFVLADGAIHFIQDDERRYRRIRFATMGFSLDVRGLVQRMRARDLTTARLIELAPRIARGEQTELSGSEPMLALELELQRRASFPMASLLLAIAAVPLGIRPLRAGRSAGALTALVLVGAYWLLASVGQLAAEEGFVRPFVGAWAPNAAVLAVGVLLLRRTTRIEA